MVVTKEAEVEVEVSSMGKDSTPKKKEMKKERGNVDTLKPDSGVKVESKSMLCKMRNETEKTLTRKESKSMLCKNERLEKELTCSLCRNILTEPVTLNCLHHVCMEHITTDRQRITQQASEKGLPLSSSFTFTCGIKSCSQSDRSASDHSYRLNHNFEVNHFLDRICKVWKGDVKIDDKNSTPLDETQEQENIPPPNRCEVCCEDQSMYYCSHCRADICDNCRRMTHTKGVFSSHEVRLLEDELDCLPKRLYCNVHTDNHLTLYCKDCHQMGCPMCFLDGDHKGHTRRHDVTDTYSTCMAEIEKEQENVSKMEAKLKSFLVQLNEMGEAIEVGGEDQQQQIKDELNRLRDNIKAIEVKLLEQSSTEIRKKKTQNDTQIKAVQMDLEALTQQNNRAESLKKLKSQHTFVALARTLQRDLKNDTEKPRGWECKASKEYKIIRCDKAMEQIMAIHLFTQGPLVEKCAHHDQTTRAADHRVQPQPGFYGHQNRGQYIAQTTQMFTTQHQGVNPVQLLPTQSNIQMR